MVVTGDPNFDFQSFGSVGDWSWRVYLNEGDKFSTSAINWATPDHGSGVGFYNLFRGSASRHWSTMDLDGDGFVEIVLTGNPAFDFQSFGALGNWHWEVYPTGP